MSKFSDELQNLLGDHQPKEIEELCLDEFTENIKSLQPYQKEGLQLYNNLIHLSLNNIGLENLENFPEIKCLMILSLKNNKLKGDDFSIIPELYPNLYKLKISFNQIESIDNLSSLKKMKLKKLEVKENPFTKNDNEYRDKIYNMLPSLDIIDQMMKNGQEVDTTDYGNDSSSSDDEEDENMEDNEDEEDDDDSDEKDGNSNDSEEEYYEENEDDEGGKKKKKK
jgi:acidic leucine-rich nuclear phosphoprotein 32 family protein A/C/D